MDKNSLRERLSQLHVEMSDAVRSDPKSQRSLDESMQELRRLMDAAKAPGAAPGESLPTRLEGLAVQFEAEHPTLAASARRLIDLLGEVGI